MKQISETTGICFFRAATDTRVIDLLADADFSPLANPSRDVIREWLHYGSIYLEGKRVREDVAVLANQVLRVHTRRKTYVTQIPDLKARVAFDHPDFLLLDKPSGLPTHPTLDNYIENASYLLQEQLGQNVYVTHRLDVATAGLLILAKSPKAQVAFNKQFAKRQVRKIYRARTPIELTPGLVTHYMDPESRVPKMMSVEAVEGWWECRLEILSSTRDGEAWSNVIQLHTGKTHQIRAQLKTLGAPIDGDSTYGSMRAARDGQIDLESYELGFRWMQEEIRVTRKERG